MIHGIGTDIIEVRRIENAIERHGERFLNHIFSQQEQLYCLKHRDSARHFAGRFAAKEATVKALGIGLRKGIQWLDIEISNDSHGKPSIFFSERAKEIIGSLHCLVSISHCHEYATGFVICITVD